MDTPKWKKPDDCAHYWKPTGGGDPVFKVRFHGHPPVVHVRCAFCNARTWFTREQWAEIPAMIDPGEGR